MLLNLLPVPVSCWIYCSRAVFLWFLFRLRIRGCGVWVVFWSSLFVDSKFVISTKEVWGFCRLAKQTPTLRFLGCVYTSLGMTQHAVCHLLSIISMSLFSNRVPLIAVKEQYCTFFKLTGLVRLKLHSEVFKLGDTSVGLRVRGLMVVICYL